MRLPSNNPVNKFIQKNAQKAVEEMSKRAPTMESVKQRVVQSATNASAKMSNAKQAVIQGATQGANMMANAKKTATTMVNKQIANMPDVKKMAIEHATKQINKHGPTAIDTKNRFMSGVRALPGPPTLNDPVKLAGETVGGLGQEALNRKIKSVGETGMKKAANAISNTNPPSNNKPTANKPNNASANVKPSSPVSKPISQLTSKPISKPTSKPTSKPVVKSVGVKPMKTGPDLSAMKGFKVRPETE